MAKKILTAIRIPFILGLIFLCQQFYFTISRFPIRKDELIPTVNCSQFGFGKKSLNDILIYEFLIMHNELDMLEIHLYELYDYIDLFLIAESDLTFTGEPKPFYLKDNWARFSRYHNKIRRVEVPLWDLINTTKSTWDNERRMRDKGIRLALPNSTKYNFH